MNAVLDEWGRVLLACAVALPLVVAAAWLLARHRTDGKSAVAEVAMVAGTAPWVWMIMTPKAGEGGVNLVPGPDLWNQLTGAPATAVVQVVGNLLVLAAFGAFAPVRWKIGPLGVAAVAAVLSLVLEILQYALSLGRVSSVDDVLVNAVGAGLAALVTRRWWKGR